MEFCGRSEPVVKIDLVYSNFITICAAAVGSTLLVIFKSRCVKISVCFGLWSCDREVQDGDDDDDEAILPPGSDRAGQRPAIVPAGDIP